MNQIIALVIIGALLIIIIAAFVFSSSFRKDVIASEGEASILGLFNVKGVLIILLAAIFCGALIYVFEKGSDKEKALQENMANKTEPNVTHYGSLTKKILVDDNVKWEIKPIVSAVEYKMGTKFNVAKKVSGVEDFYFCVESAEFIGGDSLYLYQVRFGEKPQDGNMDDIIWEEVAQEYPKTPSARFTDIVIINDVRHKDWRRQYKVMMALGQPLMEKKEVQMLRLVVFSGEVTISEPQRTIPAATASASGVQ
ncbi:uncharacterized protein (UPF0333 family) [Parabacteroides sp. PFB2-10]|uniref:hypothetical protein n=1 Tax=Parabacteroides sp. PFB2-10 TaxID=1742405 RepID=UPI0024746D9A|nr:hypothetical protein [Parabacteroides sp. PFB2-10]MDH6312475.1 uncharacterized protein (UPF0333 family) [Parabacteroides sp. PFB2-10]MDL2245118.1 hypothetical protein [Parabacteroides sp. OttesenSCG-928-J18]